MRIKLALLGCISLEACATALEPTVAPAPVAAVPFVVPSDPGKISCNSLNNPNALTEATNWALGRARAAVLSGRLSDVPASETITQNLSTYCNANQSANLAAAVTQMGL